jgi:hypothetical protein
MRALLLITVFVIIVFSLITVAKPAFYLRVLDTDQEIRMEFGEPVRQALTEKGETLYLYETGFFRPLCVDYLVTLSQGKVKEWTWRWCEGESQTQEPG